MAFTITHTTRSYPHGPYEAIKNRILGTGYDCSLTFIGTERAATLNKQTRGKRYSPNVLSFPLTDDTGEIYIRLPIRATEARAYGHSITEHAHFLFIHGCLHLAGYAHGEEMEKKEQHYKAQFANS